MIFGYHWTELLIIVEITSILCLLTTSTTKTNSEVTGYPLKDP
jgi:hypothetical protein